jgi:adenylate cyclase
MKNPVVSSLVCSATSVPPEQVRAQLERILVSSSFTAGKSASRFLRYVVEETLAGRGDQIKEYVVGAAVFDRGADYDPRTDAVVRVEATRLRAKLRDYYRSDGTTDPVSIELPKGSYVPVFDSLQATAPLKPPFRYPPRSAIALALGIVLLTGIALHWVLGGSGSDATGNLHAAVAVLPFKNLSGDPSSEYFSDGLAEELIGALIRIEGLRVPARTSSFAFKGTQHDIREIGQKLGVSSVLEGSTQIIGNRVRVTARLIQVKDGYLVWSQDYERPLRDVFAIQADISRSIVNALRIQLSGPAARALVRPKPNSLEAYSLYLKGRFHSHARAGGWEQDRTAAEYFEQAIQKDPGYVNAYAALASWYTSYQSRELPIQS